MRFANTLWTDCGVPGHEMFAQVNDILGVTPVHAGFHGDSRVLVLRSYLRRKRWLPTRELTSEEKIQVVERIVRLVRVVGVERLSSPSRRGTQLR